MSYVRNLILFATFIFIGISASNASADADDFNLANKFESEMHFFLIVSECILLQVDTLKISVSKSPAEKCVRCWHRNKSVGSDNKHPELCNRCVENLDGPGEDIRFA